MTIVNKLEKVFSRMRYKYRSVSSRVKILKKSGCNIGVHFVTYDG